MRSIALFVLCLECTRTAQKPLEEPVRGVVQDSEVADSYSPDANSMADAATESANTTLADEDPMARHFETREQLLSLFSIQDYSPEQLKAVRPDLFLNFNVGMAKARMSQGNKAIAHHSIGKQACLEGLKNVVLQTEEQKTKCGSPNMVPIYRNGDSKTANYCIDLFEFPNQACELPFVWTAPTHAQTMCALQGKRLCSQGEWQLACRADPAGGDDRLYAYGDSLDLTICNTQKPRMTACDPRTLDAAWNSCGTDTEPAGAFPACRSRFGVFDQHGNVAEVMTRTESGHVLSQLKGSAFFYREVARYSNAEIARAAKAKETLPSPPKDRETYPDTCNYDPRWHVEPIEAAWHINYHLGFRCCKSIAPEH